MVHFMFITLLPSYVAPMDMYVTRMHSHVTRMYLYVLVCYSYVTRMLLVCHSYVTRMYSCSVLVTILFIIQVVCPNSCASY